MKMLEALFQVVTEISSYLDKELCSPPSLASKVSRTSDKSLQSSFPEVLVSFGGLAKKHKMKTLKVIETRKK